MTSTSAGVTCGGFGLSFTISSASRSPFVELNTYSQATVFHRQDVPMTQQSMIHGLDASNYTSTRLHFWNWFRIGWVQQKVLYMWLFQQNLQAACPFFCPNNTVKALTKTITAIKILCKWCTFLCQNISLLNMKHKGKIYAAVRYSYKNNIIKRLWLTTDFNVTCLPSVTTSQQFNISNHYTVVMHLKW